MPYVAFRVSRKVALPPSSPPAGRASPVGKHVPFTEPSFTVCQSPVKRNPPLGFPTGPLWRETTFSRAFLYTSFSVPNDEALPSGSPEPSLVHLSRYTSSPRGSPKGFQWRDARLQGRWGPKFTHVQDVPRLRMHVSTSQLPHTLSFITLNSAQSQLY